MAVEIGALRALLSLDSAAFEKGIKRAQGALGDFQRRMGRVERKFADFGKKMTTRVTVPIVAGFAGLVASSSNAANEISRLSAIANTSATDFQRFAVGAKTVGIENEKLADILKDVNDRVGDFIATGGGPMADFFENIAPQVGVTAEQFAKLSGPEALQLYVSSLEKAGVSQQEMTFYMEALASDATALIPLLRDGGKEMQRLGDRAQDLGQIMSQDTIDSLERSRDSMRRFRASAASLGNQLIAALAPTLEKLADFLASLAKAFASLDPATQKFIAGAALIAAGIGPAALAISAAAKTVAVLAAGLAALASPIGLVVAGLSALAAGAAYVYLKWDELVERFPILQTALDAFKERVASIVDGLKGMFGALGDAWRALADLFVSVVNLDFKGAMDALRNYLQAGIDFWKNVFQVIFPETIRNAISAILAALRDLGNRILSWLKDIGGTIKDAAFQLGADLANGIKDGILGRAASVREAVRGAAQSVISVFKDETETRSPSQVFARIGSDLMEGARVGIEGNTGAAVDAAGNAANAVAGAFELPDQQRSFGDYIQQGIDGIADALAGVITQGRNLRESLAQVFQQIANDLISSGIKSLLNGLFSGFGSGGGGFLSGIFGGFRAMGGPIEPGKAYVVGEKGPEVIVPQSRGVVVPNGKVNSAPGGMDMRQIVGAIERLRINPQIVLDPADVLESQRGRRAFVGVAREEGLGVA